MQIFERAEQTRLMLLSVTLTGWEGRKGPVTWLKGDLVVCFHLNAILLSTSQILEGRVRVIDTSSW